MYKMVGATVKNNGWYLNASLRLKENAEKYALVIPHPAQGT